ncbi:MAG TPA: outer membrane beta-barrel protein [Chitinophaga sp.]|nr:outer membrane beta-barrel protein [Chitinophaga sp.]
MRLIILLLFIIAFTRSGYAQPGMKISGQVTDAHTQRSLEGATVSVLNKKTGIFINYGVTGHKGMFQVGGLPESIALEIIVSFSGYRDTSATFTLSGKTKLFNTGVWKLDTAVKELEALVVTARRPPFVVKNDTLEFNASSFKSLPNDMVQDLLRRLPGMQVDADGNVTVNGKKVNKIRVDGRDFFGGNLKAAMENLPVSVIDKVQVMDSRERGREHNSIITPLSENVTINLTLKEDKKKGQFGNLAAGYGTNDRYVAAGSVNSFSGKQRLSIMGNTSNINGMGMLMGASKGGGMMQQESGILKNSSVLGFNLNNDWDQKGKMDFSYLFNSREAPSETVTAQTNLLPDSSFFYNSRSLNNSRNSMHNLRNNYELLIDSLQYLSMETSVSFSNNSNDAFMSAVSATTGGDKINTQDNRNRNTEKAFSLNNQLAYGWSSRDRRSNLNANWNFGMQRQSGQRSNLSANIFYIPAYQADSLNQQGYSKGNGFNNNISLNFSRQLYKNLTGIINYTLQQSFNVADLDIYNYDPASHSYSRLDSLYSNHNRNTNLVHVASASLGYRINKLSVELGGSYRIIDQQNRLVWKDSTVSVKQRNFSPRLSTSYQISKRSSWTTHYSAESSAPSTDQLSPVQDNTNPLYIKAGNPFLRSSITQNVSTDLMYYSKGYKWNMGIRGSGSFTDNQIVNDTYYDTLGRQISTYRNVNGARNFSLMAMGDNRFKLHAWTLSVGWGANLAANRNVNIVNRELNAGRTLNFSPQLRLGLQCREKVFLMLSGSIQYNSTRYSLAGIEDVDYQLKRVESFFRVVPVKRFSIGGSVSHTFNGQLPADFQRSSTLVNMMMDYNLLKSQQLAVGISVNDLLNQNTSISRSVTPTMIQNTQTMTLRRFGLLTLRYRFYHFNGAAGKEMRHFVSP